MVARGRSDTERLQTGELVYAGVRRTPVCALATELPVRGIATGLAAEIFASTLDVYLTLGDIESNPTDLSTADGRPATVEAARDRLARMVAPTATDSRQRTHSSSLERPTNACSTGWRTRPPGLQRPRSVARRRRWSPARASFWRGGWPRVDRAIWPDRRSQEAWGFSLLRQDVLMHL